MDTFVERDEVEVLRVLADWTGGGPAEAMHRLEARLPSLKGRRFYGTFRMLPTGEEYYACVERVESDDPAQMGLETGTIPGGLYLRRKLSDWQKVIAEGKLGEQFEEMLRTCHPDRSRPSIEFYRSMAEMHLLEPVLNRESVPRPPS
ncbi:MAG TPA: GyrI-like domain-containing protein [Thermoplasmata archaeon]|nr:GyrI-like domain-containing protein [Thermoplasmata archaeon]